MRFDEASNYLVISSGQKKLTQLQKDNYLHNKKGNYEQIGGDFVPVDIAIMDKIMRQILAKQRMREAAIYKMLDITDIDEFNKLYILSGGNNEFIDTTIEDILDKAADECFSGDESTRMTKQNKSQFSSTVSRALEAMVNEYYGIDDKIGAELKNGLSEFVAKRLATQNKKKVKIEKLDDYKKRIAEAMRSNWRGELAEKETELVVGLMLELFGKAGTIERTGKNKNAYGKFIKADSLLVLNDSFSIGIQNKNYLINEKGNTEVSLHTSGSLKNFYKLIEESSVEGIKSLDITGMRKVIDNFQTPYFKYHLINQAAFSAAKGEKRIENTSAGENIINFIKMCLPLFMGAQIKIKGDKHNVDFFNVSGHFIPVSTIMEEIFYKRSRLGRGIKNWIIF